MASEFVLVSPDGFEERTASPVYRSRLLAQGYDETQTADHATDTPANPPQATQRSETAAGGSGRKAGTTGTPAPAQGE